MYFTMLAFCHRERVRCEFASDLFPCSFSCLKETYLFVLLSIVNLMRQQGEHDAAGDGRAEDAGEVWPHSMHDEKIAAVFLLPDQMGDAGSNRHRCYARRSDERIDPAVGQFAHNARAEDAGAGTAYESHEPQRDDQQRVRREKGICGHSGTDGDGEDQSDNVQQSI